MQSSVRWSPTTRRERERTFEFQARGFYERLGYRCFGELNDYPTGFARYFMKKALDT